MTHTLHRIGKVATLEEDYVLLVMSSKGINDAGSAKKLKKALKIILRHNPVNIGDMRKGNIFTKSLGVNALEKICENVKDTSILHGVFTNKDMLIKVLKEIKEANLGLSVVISGLFDEVFDIARVTGLSPHTVELSLGVWGRKDLLNGIRDVLEITTMCGHNMISPRLAEQLVSHVREGKTTPEEAGRQLAAYCTCGIFNPNRAAKLIRELTLNKM